MRGSFDNSIQVTDVGTLRYSTAEGGKLIVVRSLNHVADPTEEQSTSIARSARTPINISLTFPHSKLTKRGLFSGGFSDL